MNISQCTKIRHISFLLLHFLYSIICFCNTLFHCFLSSHHFCFSFFNSFQMTIIFFLFDWLVWNSWFSSHSSCIKLNLLFYCLFTCNQHLLKLSSFSFCFSNSLNMFSVFINGWIFSGFFFGLGFLLSGIFSKFCLSFGWGHFSPWFFFLEHSISSGSKGSGMLCSI